MTSKKVTKKKAAVKSEPTVVVKERTDAEKIWDTIKNVQLDMFALPDQTVSKYCTPIAVEPSKLYLTYKGIGAVLPAMETALSKKYNVEVVDKYIVVSNKSALK